MSIWSRAEFDGTSLMTVDAVDHDGFEVLPIPHTLAATTRGDRNVGDRVNIEAGQMAPRRRG
jgi:riboflavin synthase